MSSKNNKPKKEIKKDEKISSVIEVKEKDNKLLYILVIVILILLSLLIYFIFFNKKEDKCDSCCSAPVIEIETDPKYQLINYEGFRFKMPLDWDFVSNDSIYSIVDTLTELGNISKVQFFIEGESKITFRETVNLDTTFLRNLDLIRDNQ